MIRPPIVTILGHVDHGKTTLLDYIKKTKLTEKEHGGITQSIGGYEIKTDAKGYQTDKITFIDTPGHEAFSKLRSQGANVADIALLLIDAKDSVKPQTIESISHIKAAKVPFIVVLNKIDLPEANAEKVKLDLIKHDVLVEGKGGKIPVVTVSAKTGKGVEELLETILLLASDLNLKADLNNKTLAYIIETKKDRRGIVISAVIKDGKLKIADIVYADGIKTKVRSMTNDLGQSIREVVPTAPFELLGFEKMPPVGALISNESREKAEEKEQVKEAVFDMSRLLQPKEDKKIALIIKADSQGSLEAITDSISENENIETILKAIGEVNKSDIFLAKTAKAIIISFNTKILNEAAELAKQEKVIIKTYNIIYELLEELSEVSRLLKEKKEANKNLKGEAKILATFLIHDEKVYGIKVTKGKANLNDPIEIYRDGSLVGKAKIASLQIRAKKVEEVKKDQEAGIIISPRVDMRQGDVVKFIL